MKTLPAIIALLVAACGPHSPAVESGSTTSVGDDTTSSITTTSSSTSSTGSLPDLGEPVPPPDLPSPVDTDRDLLVFLTHKIYRGDMIPAHGQTPDEICAWHGRLHDDKVWRAWVSTGDDSPAASFTRTSGWYKRMDGVPIAQGWADLTDGDILAPINVNEFGNVVIDDLGYHGVWTGTHADGTAAMGDKPEWGPANCTNWTTADWSGAHGSAVFGWETVTDSRWSEVVEPDRKPGMRNCVGAYNLYCFEQ